MFPDSDIANAFQSGRTNLIRFWDDGASMVSTRYLGSEFMGRATADAMTFFIHSSVVSQTLINRSFYRYYQMDQT